MNHYPTRNTRPIVRPGLLILLVLLAASGVGCGSGGCGGGRTVAEERAYRAARATGPILIGVAADPEGSMWRGIRMAVEETNAAGGVLGRELRVVQRYDESSVAKAKLVAQQFARNLDIVAVIGHWGSDMAISASATYEFAGLLMICPAATSPKLTEQGFHLVFRTSPSNRRVGPRLAEFAADQGYQRVMIVSARDAYGRGLGNVFEMRAAEAGITVVDRASYQDGERNFEPLLADWGRLDFDAVFVAGTMPEAAHVVAQARRVGVSRPVLGGEGLATDALWEIAGEAAEAPWPPPTSTPPNPGRRYSGSRTISGPGTARRPMCGPRRDTTRSGCWPTPWRRPARRSPRTWPRLCARWDLRPPRPGPGSPGLTRSLKTATWSENRSC